MILNCVIIDDEPLAIGVIAEYINRTPSLTLLKQFTNSVKASEYLSENKADILFIDIQMPDLNGIELVKKLEYKPAIIFTTAFDKYALEGFRADAVDYLLKPVDYPEFLKSVEKAGKWIVASNKVLDVRMDKQFLFIRSEHKISRIELSSIKFIEGMSEYVRIHRENAKPIMSLLSLKSLEGRLPENMFMRVHKSYIVNLSKITEIENNIIICNDGKMIPVSKMYKQQLQDYINNNFIF